MALGRPTKYRVEFCEALMNHMAQGFSYESFGGRVGVCEETLRLWEQAHPDFLRAKKIGHPACRLWWETTGIDGMTSGSINATIWIFNMKNRFRWRDVEPEEIDAIQQVVNAKLRGESTINLVKMLIAQKKEPMKEAVAVHDEE